MGPVTGPNGYMNVFSSNKLTLGGGTLAAPSTLSNLYIYSTATVLNTGVLTLGGGANVGLEARW